MDSRHQSFNDTILVVDDLCERSKTVGGARSVGDDIVFGFVSIKVHTTDKHGSIGRGSRDDDFLCSAFEMGSCLVLGGENSRRLDDVFSTALSPRDICGISLAVDIDVLSIDDQLASFSVDITLESSMGRVIFEHVDHVFKIDEGIVDSLDFDILVAQGIPEDNTTDTAKSVDSDVDGHCNEVLEMN